MDELIRRLELVKSLTPRERDVLHLLCDGQELQAIATQLGVSKSTVRFHVGNIYDKLGMAEMQQAPRRVALGRMCQALSTAEPDPPTPTFPAMPEPKPLQPSLRALAAVEEDDKERARKNRALVVAPPAATQMWQPIPVPPIERERRPQRNLLPIAIVAAVAVVAAAGLVAFILRGNQTTVVERALESASATPVVPPAAAVVTPAPTATPIPRPTPQAIPPTFVVNTQPVGCHTEPSTEAPNLAQQPALTLLTMDQVFRLPGATWHREATQQCWVRTQPGPLETFTNEAQARALIVRLAPIGTVLYQANWMDGPAGWPTPDGWQASRGQLLSQTREYSKVTAPFVPGRVGLDDYAVEAEILHQGMRNTGQIGLFVRDRYQGGIKFDVTQPAEIGFDQIYAGFSGTETGRRNASYRFPADGRWHTFRLEVEGNAIRLKIDGGLVVEWADNRMLSGGSIGIINNFNQISVRAFRVIKL